MNPGEWLSTTLLLASYIYDYIRLWMRKYTLADHGELVHSRTFRCRRAYKRYLAVTRPVIEKDACTTSAVRRLAINHGAFIFDL